MNLILLILVTSSGILSLVKVGYSVKIVKHVTVKIYMYENTYSKSSFVVELLASIVFKMSCRFVIMCRFVNFPLCSTVKIIRIFISFDDA